MRVSTRRASPAQGAMVVNTARASIVDTATMIEALRKGTLAAAALDVYDQEPLPPLAQEVVVTRRQPLDEALGADRGRVMQLVLGSAFRRVAAGLLLGVGGSDLAARVIHDCLDSPMTRSCNERCGAAAAARRGSGCHAQGDGGAIDLDEVRMQKLECRSWGNGWVPPWS